MRALNLTSIIPLGFAIGCSTSAALAECGIASNYSSGTVTANGERFKPNGVSAAHKKLPFGTKVAVINRGTGRSIVVRINDGALCQGAASRSLRRGAESARRGQSGARLHPGFKVWRRNCPSERRFISRQTRAWSAAQGGGALGAYPGLPAVRDLWRIIHAVVAKTPTLRTLWEDGNASFRSEAPPIDRPPPLDPHRDQEFS